MLVEDGKYYLYRHIRLDTNEVFYVGVGTKTIIQNRQSFREVYKRAFLKATRSKFWKDVMKKSGYSVEIICESDDYIFIEEKEKEFIKLYGRRDLGKGTLVNFTDGGKGQRGIINKSHTPETRKKMSLAAMGREFTSDHRQKLSEAKRLNPPKHSLNKNHTNKTKQKFKNRYKKHFTVLKNNIKEDYYLSQEDLGKLLGFSSRTVKRLLTGEICRENIKIWLTNSAS